MKEIKTSCGETEKTPEVSKMIDQKFLDKRQVFLWGGVDDKSAKDIVSKLLYLEMEAPGEPITFFINSPGGSVTAGLSILDTMAMISSPVSTVCMGLAASMGSILLSAGEKGKRFIYPHGEVMIHQPSIGYLQGVVADLEITAKQMSKTKEIAAQILADNCGKDLETVQADFDRDYWMDADESIEYGIVDGLFKF